MEQRFEAPEAPSLSRDKRVEDLCGVEFRVPEVEVVQDEPTLAVATRDRPDVQRVVALASNQEVLLLQPAYGRAEPKPALWDVHQLQFCPFEWRL